MPRPSLEIVSVEGSTGATEEVRYMIEFEQRCLFEPHFDRCLNDMTSLFFPPYSVIDLRRL